MTPITTTYKTSVALVEADIVLDDSALVWMPHPGGPKLRLRHDIRGITFSIHTAAQIAAAPTSDELIAWLVGEGCLVDICADYDGLDNLPMHAARLFRMGVSDVRLERLAVSRPMPETLAALCLKVRGEK